MATAYPVTMIIDICIVKATRSQKPAPNHCAVWTNELPDGHRGRRTPRQRPQARARTRQETSARTSRTGGGRRSQALRTQVFPACGSVPCASAAPCVSLRFYGILKSCSSRLEGPYLLVGFADRGPSATCIMANLGYVGLGVMGGRMVDRLLDKGHTVTGYNRTKSKAQWLLDKGMKWGDYAARRRRGRRRDLRRWSPTRRRSRRSPTVPTASSPVSAPARSSIDMSTVSPAVSRALAEKVRARGADMVDSPGLRQRHHARAGQADDDGGRRGARRSSGSSRCCSTSARRPRTSATTVWRCR